MVVYQVDNGGRRQGDPAVLYDSSTVGYIWKKEDRRAKHRIIWSWQAMGNH